MKTYIRILALVQALTIGLFTFSVAHANDLGTCMVDSLNGKERKQLAKWMFFGIAAHPEISVYSRATPHDIEESDQLVGRLFTRVLTEDCPTELREAAKSNSRAIEKSFELVGQVAMQELITNEKVANAISSYARYLNQEKIDAVLLGK
jgi:hypothetical protein